MEMVSGSWCGAAQGEGGGGRLGEDRRKERRPFRLPGWPGHVQTGERTSRVRNGETVHGLGDRGTSTRLLASRVEAGRVFAAGRLTKEEGGGGGAKTIAETTVET